MTLVTAIVVGVLLGYRVRPQLRAFMMTVAAIVGVLIPQTILLWNTERRSVDGFYPLVQLAIIAVAYATTWSGAWFRNRQATKERGAS